MKDKVIHFQVEDGKMYLLYESGKIYMAAIGKDDWQKVETPSFTKPKE